jgi:REP element-mobilizing transposase RayT
MATPRSQLVDNELALHYHLVSRCVRSSWLCGWDKPSRKKYDHRKTWIEDRIFRLAQFFAIEVHGFAILDNHFHLVVFFDPLACQRWDDAEVARRWTEAFPPRVSPHYPQDLDALKEAKRQEIMDDPIRLAHSRATLGDLSAFMKHLKQPISWRANREDNCRGHFFEKRFFSGAILSEKALLATMAYVDLNPVRAKICDSIEGYQHTSIYQRLQHLERSPEQLREFLRPLVSGLEDAAESRPLTITLEDYIHHLRLLSPFSRSKLTDEQAVWFNRVASIRKRQRAYGLMNELIKWGERHGWRRTGDALV